ncbi:hypothetical protein ACJX0J_037989, partial [Zea mays]
RLASNYYPTKIMLSQKSKLCYIKANFFGKYNHILAFIKRYIFSLFETSDKITLTHTIV